MEEWEEWRSGGVSRVDAVRLVRRVHERCNMTALLCISQNTPLSMETSVESIIRSFSSSLIR